MSDSKPTFATNDRLTVDKCFAVHCSRCGVLDVGLYADLMEMRRKVLENEHVCKR